jgi:hypothetical protein
VTPSDLPPEIRRPLELASELLTVMLHETATGPLDGPSDDFNLVLDEIRAGGESLLVRTLGSMALLAERAVGLAAEGRDESPEETWQWLARQ